ncbi:MAG: hypothetical protein NW224_21480 [Leptolyngbyaceae cyanobacterium bins.302]|nr:hypothetical protein [Leptolyngbyaceae cyanobacterium bins.302]
MKCASFVVLGLVSAIVPVTPALSQSPEMLSSAEPQNQSELLTTYPLTVERSKSVDQPSTVFDANKLSRIADSIQANPVTGESGSSPRSSSPIPKDLFHVPSKVLSDTHPLEMFQPPAPNQSFGINLNRL